MFSDQCLFSMLRCIQLQSNKLKATCTFLSSKVKRASSTDGSNMKCCISRIDIYISSLKLAYYTKLNINRLMQLLFFIQLQFFPNTGFNNIAWSVVVASTDLIIKSFISMHVIHRLVFSMLKLSRHFKLQKMKLQGM